MGERGGVRLGVLVMAGRVVWGLGGGGRVGIGRVRGGGKDKRYH